MGNRLMQSLKRDVLPSCTLSTTSVAALLLLVDGAPDEAPLTWPAHGTLAKWIKCRENYICTVLAAIEAAGFMSVWRRSGRGSVYLIHPEGRAHLVPLASKAVRRQLRGHFSTADINAALVWLADIGALDRSGARATPPLSRGVHTSQGKALHSVEGAPSTQSRGTPPLSRDEPKENPKLKPNADSRPAKLDGLAGPAPHTPGPAVTAGDFAALIASLPDATKCGPSRARTARRT